MPKPLYHHVAICVSDLEASKKFYDPIVELLGLKLTHNYGAHGYYGFSRPEGYPAEFGISKGKVGSNHFAFAVDSEEEVKKLYDAALAAGGKDNGAPGLRTQYGPKYYAAFFLDPDGNNIEAVWSPNCEMK
ncbi:asparaginyl-tRNA synthetase [Umbelopsis sp. PMI_123]|nr:asparaginyl-tRNA synthetase [Umbelopsis sp. PMI_123]